MQEFFDGRGPWGSSMMCSTASTQVCLDAGEPSDVPLRWHALHSVGPALVALFANSPVVRGRDTGWASNRLRATLGTCPPFSHPLPTDRDPVGSWVERVMAAPVVCVRRARGHWSPTRPMTFAAWVAGRGERPPTYGDLDYHLSTLFPPVRPRGYVEVRYLDTQPPALWHQPLLLLDALLSSRQLTERACELTEHCADRWLTAARRGLDDPDLRRAARDLVDLAADHLAQRHGGPSAAPHRPRRKETAGMSTSERERPLADLTVEQLRTHAADALYRSRTRSTALTDAVDDDDLVRQHSPLMSPLVWDLAHVGNQEELWLVRDVGRREPVRSDIDELYDAFKHGRASRPALPLLGPAEARSYVREVRDKVLDVLGTARLEGSPLVEDAFAFGMVAQHEQQHDETMLATHQLRAGAPVLHAEEPPPPREPLPAQEVLVPAGEFTMGTSTEPWALDNERPAHPAYTDAYFIDTAPVSYGDYLRFVEAGGYAQQRVVVRRGVAARAGSRPRGPPVPHPRRRPLDAAALRPRGAGPRRRARHPRVLLRGRGVRRGGSASGCRRRRSGRRQRGGTLRAAARVATRGGTRTPAPSTPTSASDTCVPHRPAPTRREPPRSASTS